MVKNKKIKEMLEIKRLGTPTAIFPIQSKKTFKEILPGLFLCGGVGAACIIIGKIYSGFSPMLVSVLLGILVRNIVKIPSALEPGIGVAAKRFLRVGVVLLGLQVSISSIIKLGFPVLITDILALSITFVLTLYFGKKLKIDADLTALIAAGFSICGAAAIAGFQSTIKASEEKVSASVALVVLYGTMMLGIVPLIIQLLNLDAGQGSTLVGATIHEVAQVVAAAGIAGGGILTFATIVKLARVSMMAPVMFIYGFIRNKSKAEASEEKKDKAPLLPLFVVGFVLMVIISSTNILSVRTLTIAKEIQQIILAISMFGLGLGVHFRTLKKLGIKPILLGLISTCIIILVVLISIKLGLSAKI